MQGGIVRNVLLGVAGILKTCRTAVGSPQAFMNSTCGCPFCSSDFLLHFFDCILLAGQWIHFEFPIPFLKLSTRPFTGLLKIHLVQFAHFSLANFCGFPSHHLSLR
jgi:hypothetical protein